MTESIEFDVVREYSLFDVGITVDTNLRFADLDVDVSARLDTGASYCIFSRYLGEELGIEIESGIAVLIGTATGSFRVFGHQLTMTVCGLEFVSTVYFAESVHFDRNVLGRIGFLDRVKLGLIEPEGKLLLSRYQR